MSRRRPARGRAAPRRAPSRRPAYDDYQDDYDDYDDRYDRRRGSGALPWILVSLFVVGAFVLLVFVASGNDDAEDENAGSGSPKVYDFSYKPFQQEYNFLLRHDTETKQKHSGGAPGSAEYDKWMGETIGTMQITYSGGTGSVATKVRTYRKFLAGGRKDERPPEESPLSGRSFAFRLGAKGGFHMEDPKPETAVMHAMLCYMFPDFPAGAVDYKRQDKFSWGNRDEIVGKIRFLAGSQLDIVKYEMDVVPGRPGTLTNWGSGVTELRWVGGEGSYAGNATGVRHHGKSKKAYWSGTARCKLIMDYRTGMPVQLTSTQIEWSHVGPHTDDEWTYTDEYTFQVNPIKR